KDAQTGAPVSNAILQVKGGLSEDPEMRWDSIASVQTDEGGQVIRRRTRPWAGQCGFFLSSFEVSPPPWQFRVSAAGYENSEWTHLGHAMRETAVTRTARVTTCTIAISLTKQGP